MTPVLLLLLILLQFDQYYGTDDNRIVGGRPALEGEFPYQVSLRRTYNNKHFCGGSLINSNHILTAAHCMYYIWGGILPPIVVYVVAGQTNLSLSSYSVTRNVSKITIHPSYNKTTMDNDVAILQLLEPFETQNPLIQIASLRSKEIIQGPCIVSGWGVDNFESSIVSEMLMAAEIDIIDTEECKKKYAHGSIKTSMICAGTENGDKDACQGDSGGPLMCDGLLTGVISTGKGCADAKFPGIYANISYLEDWILLNANMKFNNNAENDTDASVPLPEALISSTSDVKILNSTSLPHHTARKGSANQSKVSLYCLYVICLYFLSDCCI